MAKRTKKAQMFRQGDVLLQQVDFDPTKEGKDVKQVEPNRMERLVLAEGEATGHSHTVDAGHALMYMTAIGMFLRVVKEAQLLHEEHASIDLETGWYKVTRQREYHPEALRNVAD
jgi:hypothetical protein